MNTMDKEIEVKYEIALGKLIMSSGNLEMVYKKLFTLITKVEAFTAEIIIAKMPFSRFLELTLEIVKKKHKKDKDLIDNLVKTVKLAQDAIKKRNEVVHSGWISGIPENENTYFRYKIDLTRDEYFDEEGIPCTVNELNSIDNDLRDASQILGEFMGKFVLRKK